jgi:hypothetical protein
MPNRPKASGRLISVEGVELVLGAIGVVVIAVSRD